MAAGAIVASVQALQAEMDSSPYASGRPVLFSGPAGSDWFSSGSRQTEASDLDRSGRVSPRAAGRRAGVQTHKDKWRRQATASVLGALNEVIREDFEDCQDSGQRSTSMYTASMWSKASEAPLGGGLPLLRFRIKRMMMSRLFQWLIAAVIVANSATIGIEMSLDLKGEDISVLVILENIWLGIYVMELSLRLFSSGCHCFRDNWVKFDAILVVIGMTNSWLLPFIISEQSSDGFGFLMVLRLVRLGRLARAVRLLVSFKALWMLVQGLLSSAGTMFYTFITLSIVLYIFAALGIELITNNPLVKTDDQFRDIVMSHFNSLSGTMLTLIQFLCMDSIAAIYRPLVEKDVTLVFYFASVILVVPIVLLNLVTATIVNGALERANADKEVHRAFEERRKVQLVKRLQDIFCRLDEDNSGRVSKDEILQIEEDDITVLQNATGMSDPLEVFDLLNVDESESLSIEDFCGGIWKLATSNAPLEVQRMETQVQLMFKRIKTIEQNQSATSSQLAEIVQLLKHPNRHDRASRSHSVADSAAAPPPPPPPKSCAISSSLVTKHKFSHVGLDTTSAVVADAAMLVTSLPVILDSQDVEREAGDRVPGPVAPDPGPALACINETECDTDVPRSSIESCTRTSSRVPSSEIQRGMFAEPPPAARPVLLSNEAAKQIAPPASSGASSQCHDYPQVNLDTSAAAENTSAGVGSSGQFWQRGS